VNSKENALELILARLLGKPVAPDELQAAVELAATDPEARALFERLESLLSWQDDPAWLEDIAAAREGVITLDVAYLMENRETLAQIAPGLLTHFDTLLKAPLEDDTPILPVFPSFGERSEQEQDAKKWKWSSGFQWRRVAERLIIRLTEPLTPPPAVKLSPMPVRGNVDYGTDVIRHIILGPGETGDVDVKAVIRKSQKGAQLVAQVMIPSRWTDSGGIKVWARAGEWRAEGTTDEGGNVTLESIPMNALDDLVIEIEM